MCNSAEDLKSDLMSTITTIRGDVRYKKELLKRHEEEGSKEKIISLTAQISAITDVLNDIEQVLFN